MEDKTNNVALYIRVSTDSQAEEGYSVDIQSERLIAYCVSRGFNNYKLYIDGGWSGSNLNRPEIQNLISDIKERKINTVIVYKLDRLSRSQKDTLYFIEDLLIPHNVGFISLHENLDTGSPYGRAMIGILSAFAQLERENIRERTHSGMLERVKDGYWPGGDRTPFGYDYDSKTGTLIPNKDADTLRQIFDLYLSGYSTYKISTITGVSMPSYIDKMLTKKTYIGLIPYLGNEYKGRHEAIISQEKFEAVAREIERRSKSPSYSSSEYLLTGLLHCGVCGAKMRYQKYKIKRKDGSDYYNVKIYCNSKHKSKPYLVKDPNCTNISFNAYEIEDFVIADMLSLTVVLSKQYKEKMKGGQAKVDNKNTTLSVLQKLEERKNSLQAKIKKLYNLYAESDDEILLSTIKSLQAEYNSVEKQIASEDKKRKRNNSDNQIKDMVVTLQNTWPHMTFDEKRFVVRNVIDSVTIYHERIHIKYNLVKQG